MFGKSGYRLIWPNADGIKMVELTDAGFDPIVYSSLRDLREKFAKAEEVPAYCIFSNKTLEALARYRPKNSEEMLGVPGVGPVKAQRFGRAFLDALAKFR